LRATGSETVDTIDELLSRGGKIRFVVHDQTFIGGGRWAVCPFDS
jgi:hypothetical protein